MKTLLLTFCILHSAFCLYGQGVRPALLGASRKVGSSLAAFSDDFSGTLSNWTTNSGSWNINSGVLSQLSSGYAYDKLAHNTTCSGIDQYAKVTLFDWNGGFYGVRFRVNGTAGYSVLFNIGNDDVWWTDSADAVIVTSSLATVDGSVVGVTVSGTGTSTVIRIWHNPTGLPTSVSNWNGDTTPDIVFTTDPATPVDSGSYVGLVGTSSAGDGMRSDNFFGGDCP